jgi:hypothetical protein
MRDLPTHSRAITWTLAWPRSVGFGRASSVSEKRPKKASLGAIKPPSRGRDHNMRIDHLDAKQLQTGLFLECSGAEAKKPV